MATTQTASSFYDAISQHYDELTNAAQRSQAAEGFVQHFLQRFPAKRALDVACGTGLFTLPLARAGVETTGSDIAQAMLDRAAEHAAELGLKISFMHGAMQELNQNLTGPFDAVLCMGNSLPHLLSDEDLHAAMAAMTSLLAEDGTVVLHLLNYAKVQHSRERIVSIDRGDGRMYVRFYDFVEPLLRFNVLEIDIGTDPPQHALYETTLRPYEFDDLQRLMAQHMLREVQLFGSLDFAPFDAAHSEVLVLVGRK